MKLKTNFTVLLLVSQSVFGLSKVALADVLGLQAAVQAEPSLASQWTFDGATDADRLLDSGPAGQDFVTLNAAPVYVPGFDGSSTASDTAASDGYRTAGTFMLTESMTIEYLINPSTLTQNGTRIVAGALASSPETARIYLGVHEFQQLRLTLGRLGNSQPIIGIDDYIVDKWYYVAATVEETGTGWTANAWYANLTDGETTLTQSITDFTTNFASVAEPTNAIHPTTLPVSKPFGVGRAGQTSGSDTSFPGLIDEMTFYDTALSEAALQLHLDALLAAPTNADFDSDGDIDGEDFLTWQRGFGAIGTGTLAAGDANGDTDVNQSDLAVWEFQYGGPAPLVGAVASAVPEPSSAMLVFLGVLCWRSDRRRAR